MIRRYFDAWSNLIPCNGESKLIAVSAAQFRAIRLVIGIAASPAKAVTIQAAVKTRLVNDLGTDVTTARASLDLSHDR